MIRDQLFGKPFLMAYAGLAAYFVLAILVFKTPFAGVLLAVTAIAVFVASMRKLEWGIFIAVAELFGNSHGHLVDAAVSGFPVSLRMAVFGGVMGAWVIHVLRGKYRPVLTDLRLIPFVLMAVAVAIGFARGFAGHAFGAAFADGNAYVYLAYALPFLGITWTPATRRELLQSFMAGAAWMATVTLGLLYVFTHFPAWMLSQVYTFIRDTRTGELTNMGGNLFRVFLQGQFSVAVGALVVWALRAWRGADASRTDNRFALLGLTVAASTLVIGLSRSFWTGLAPAALALFVGYVFLRRPKPVQAGKMVSLSVISGVLGIVAIVAVILFPLPYRTGSIAEFRSVFASRTTDLGDVAISSRWNLLPELMIEIREAPLLGKGFGEEVAFTSDDPRVREIYPDGKWRTYALEWGWLELWLKMGVLGPLAFAAALILISKALWDRVHEPEGWIQASMLASLIFLAVTHVFSPYLNHPLGLGLLLLAIPFIHPKRKAPAEADALETERTKMPQASLALPMSE